MSASIKNNSCFARSRYTITPVCTRVPVYKTGVPLVLKTQMIIYNERMERMEHVNKNLKLCNGRGEILTFICKMRNAERGRSAVLSAAFRYNADSVAYYDMSCT